MPALLELFDIEGGTVSVDAMHTQWATAETVTAKGGTYVLALKGNQEMSGDASPRCPVPHGGAGEREKDAPFQ